MKKLFAILGFAALAYTAVPAALLAIAQAPEPAAPPTSAKPKPAPAPVYPALNGASAAALAPIAAQLKTLTAQQQALAAQIQAARAEWRLAEAQALVTAKQDPGTTAVRSHGHEIRAPPRAPAPVKRFALFLLALLALAAPAALGQAWSGLINAPRATDWSGSGVVGGIPSATWTQCGATLPASSSAATINAALAACGANQYVLIGPGTLAPSGALTTGTKSNVVLRGSGANSTFFVPASGASLHCADGSAFICVSSSDGSYPNGYTAIGWTGGYAQGTTQITLASVAGIVANSTIIVLNQCDDGKTGLYLSCAGTSVDNGNFYNCADIYTTAPSGCSVDGPDSGNITAGRGQSEMFYATAISGNTVTLDHALRDPNWTAARNPQAWLIQPVQYVGIEDMSIDVGNVTGLLGGIVFNNAANVWTRGVRMLHIPYTGVYHYDTIHTTDESDYFYQHNSTSGPPGADDFAVNFTQADSYLVQNNICQQIKGCWFEQGHLEWRRGGLQPALKR